MNHYYTFLALDLAHQRAVEAERDRLARASAHSDRPSLIRHGLAHGLTAVSRGSAAVARRLDDSAVDELPRGFAAE